MITMAALIFNTAILIMTFALMDGYSVGAVRMATDLVVGEAQVHAKGYLEDRSLYELVDKPEEIIAAASNIGVDAAPRTYGYGLVSVGAKSAGTQFWGVDPDTERKTFKLADHLLEGNFLSSNPAHEIVLGRKLAKSLNASIGDEIIVVVQSADGSIGNDLYYVSGILKSAGDNLDRGGALIHIDDFRELFIIDSGYHEVALNSHGEYKPAQLQTMLADTTGNNELKTWQQILPILAQMIGMMDKVMVVFAGVFFIAGGLGIMNTMLMATFDRIREFGIMKALGATPGRIVRDVIGEAFVLCLSSTLIGAILGIIGSLWLQAVGIDTSRWGGENLSFAGVAFDPIWRTALTTHAVTQTVITMWVICVLSAMYPAVLASRLEPIDAMEHT